MSSDRREQHLRDHLTCKHNAARAVTTKHIFTPGGLCFFSSSLLFLTFRGRGTWIGFVRLLHSMDTQSDWGFGGWVWWPWALWALCTVSCGALCVLMPFDRLICGIGSDGLCFGPYGHGCPWSCNLFTGKKIKIWAQSERWAMDTVHRFLQFFSGKESSSLYGCFQGIKQVKVWPSGIRTIGRTLDFNARKCRQCGPKFVDVHRHASSQHPRIAVLCV